MFGIAVALALSFIVVASSACKRAPADAAIFGTAANKDTDMAPYLALARGVFLQSPPPAPNGEAGPQRVFVTIWLPGYGPEIASAFGASLSEAVTTASSAIVKALTNAMGDRSAARVQIDRASKWEPVKLDNSLIEPVSELGTRGFAAGDGDGHFGFVLPVEVLEKKFFTAPGSKDDFARIDYARVRTVIASRAGVPEDDVDKMTVYRVWTVSAVDSTPPGKSIALYRSMPAHPETVDAPLLLNAVRAAADYLVRGMNSKGDFSYLMHPGAGTLDPSYSALRHAGTIYALADAYTETHAPEHLKGAEAAIKAMLPRLTQTPDGAFLSDRENEEQLKVGGGGLALIALVRYSEASGDRSNLETMRALAKYIVHQQYPDGHYRSNVDVRAEEDAGSKKKAKKEIWYFQGEATLGLVRLYAIDPNPAWLEAAAKAADYTLANEKPTIANHWLSYVLLDLYRLTRKQAYADHAFAIAQNISDGLISAGTADAPDQVGAMDERGETTPVATRLEATVAIMELARFIGKDDGWYRRLALMMAGFTTGQQLDAQSAYFARRPPQVVGGVRESLLNADIRIDYDQHSMCAWLRLAKLLRDPEYGRDASAADGGAQMLPHPNTPKYP
jgi:hypothetical protein